MKLNFLRSALLLIDVQNDFCPGGALAVKEGSMVIEPLNRLVSLFAGNNGRVIATQDWHPGDHVSFASSHKDRKPGETIDLPAVKNQVLWPGHCVQGTAGAAFHEKLDTSKVCMIIRKGLRRELDSYSAFFENDRKTPTGLEGFLKTLSINTVVLAGLATDYCVLYSALDAASLGHKTIVISDAVRGVNFPHGSIDNAMRLLKEAGVTVMESEGIK